MFPVALSFTAAYTRRFFCSNRSQAFLFRSISAGDMPLDGLGSTGFTNTLMKYCFPPFSANDHMDVPAPFVVHGCISRYPPCSSGGSVSFFLDPTGIAIPILPRCYLA